MKLNKIISILLALELIYALYQYVPVFLIYFSPSSIMPFLFALFIFALLLASAIGIYFNKKLGAITLWIFIFLPLLARMALGIIMFIGGYYFIVINVVAATYLTMTHWGKIKTNV